MYVDDHTIVPWYLMLVASLGYFSHFKNSRKDLYSLNPYLQTCGLARNFLLDPKNY